MVQAEAFAVLGAGSWGTALALHLQRQGHATHLWARRESHARRMAAERNNERYLPGLQLPATLRISSDLATVLAGASLALIATPSTAFDACVAQMQACGWQDKPIAWACKGFDSASGRLLHELASDRLGDAVPTAVLTGPSFARELALQLPTAVTVASSFPLFAERLAKACHGGCMRVYTSADIVGAELGGAVKNVLAVATGISDGMALGANARAALVTRGLSEMMRLGVALGGRAETLMGLSGVGDLVLTCTGEQSRNRRFGLKLGRGVSVKAAMQDIGQVVEGVHAAATVARLSAVHGIEMPISEQIAAIVAEQMTPRQGLENLLAREQKAE